MTTAPSSGMNCASAESERRSAMARAHRSEPRDPTEPRRRAVTTPPLRTNHCACSTCSIGFATAALPRGKRPVDRGPCARVRAARAGAIGSGPRRHDRSGAHRRRLGEQCFVRRQTPRSARGTVTAVVEAVRTGGSPLHPVSSSAAHAQALHACDRTPCASDDFMASDPPPVGSGSVVQCALRGDEEPIGIERDGTCTCTCACTCACTCE